MVFLLLPCAFGRMQSSLASLCLRQIPVCVRRTGRRLWRKGMPPLYLGVVFPDCPLHTPTQTLPPPPYPPPPLPASTSCPPAYSLRWWMILSSTPLLSGTDTPCLYRATRMPHPAYLPVPPGRGRCYRGVCPERVRVYPGGIRDMGTQSADRLVLENYRYLLTKQNNKLYL